MRYAPGSWQDPAYGGEGLDGAFSCWDGIINVADGVDMGVSLPGQANGPWGKPVQGDVGLIANMYAGQSNFTFVDGHSKTLNPTRTVDESLGAQRLRPRNWP